MQKVDQFLVHVRSSGKCNPEQLAFLETVCARVKAEAVTGQDRGGMAETNTGGIAMGFARWTRHREILCLEFVAMRIVRNLFRLAAR